jgi:membrane associated rhomboid family serine protease
MGYRDYPVIKKPSVWGENNSLMMLIVINVLVFILMHFIKTFYGLSHIPEKTFMTNVFDWVNLSADPLRVISRPWTLITSFFTQMNLLLLLSNLFWLWTFGYILQDLAGDRKVIPLFIYGGLTGAIVFLLTYNLIPQPDAIRSTIRFYGCVTPVIAIAAATTTISPQYRLFPMIGGGIPLWVMTLVFFVIDLASISQNPEFFIVHMASALTGYLFAKSLLKGNDWSHWMNVLFDRFTNLMNPDRTKRKRQSVREEVFYNTRGQQPFRKRSNVTQQKVDEILDKINQKGYNRLSEEEKDLLRRASEGGL